MLTAATLLVASQIAAIDIVASFGGGKPSSSQNGYVYVQDHTSGSFLINAGGNFVNLGAFAFGWEIPMLFNGPERTTTSYPPNAPAVTYSESTRWTLTPGFRFRIIPASPITPWVSVGGGVTSYERSTAVPSFPTTSNTSYGPALHIAGGVDFKALKYWLFRFEARNYWDSRGEGPLGIFAGDYRSTFMLLGGAGVRF